MTRHPIVSIQMPLWYNIYLGSRTFHYLDTYSRSVWIRRTSVVKEQSASICKACQLEGLLARWKEKVRVYFVILRTDIAAYCNALSIGLEQMDYVTSFGDTFLMCPILTKILWLSGTFINVVHRTPTFSFSDTIGVSNSCKNASIFGLIDKLGLLTKTWKI